MGLWQALAFFVVFAVFATLWVILDSEIDRLRKLLAQKDRQILTLQRERDSLRVRLDKAQAPHVFGKRKGHW